MTRQIQAAAASAAKFYRYAVLLKQVANFYNTIHEQVINSQFPMLEAQVCAVPLLNFSSSSIVLSETQSFYCTYCTVLS